MVLIKCRFTFFFFSYPHMRYTVIGGAKKLEESIGEDDIVLQKATSSPYKASEVGIKVLGM